MKFVDVKNDVAFRKIFGSDKKKVILISFLNAVLDLHGRDKIKSVTLVDPFQLPRIRGEKASIIDVRAKDGKNRSFIIEMQVAERDGFGKRVQFYSSKEYASQIDRGDDYTLLKPVYFIGILNFKFFPGENYFSKHITVDEETGVCTLDDIKFRFIELPKFRKKEHELTTVIDKWTYFIKKADKLEVIPENVNDKGLLAAYEEAQKHNWSKDEYDAYIYAGMREQDEKGRETAAEKRGQKSEKHKVVIRCLKNNMPTELTAQIAGLTIEEVKSIIKEINKEEK